MLHEELKIGSYHCGKYHRFMVNDPKPRIIHKAPVRDRLLHHAIYRKTYPLFDKTFIFDSYSCRIGKGTHKAFNRLVDFARKESKNYTRQCWALKCDIKKFFDSIDHDILLSLLSQRIKDDKLLRLINIIIDSFETEKGKGIPLGNLTSQLFANVYLDPLDKFIKHQLRHKYYLRYADDFMLLSHDKNELTNRLGAIDNFLGNNLLLKLHPNKVHMRKLTWGIDFVGYVAKPYYNLPRKKTVRRIIGRIKSISNYNEARLASYLGYLKHSHSKKKQKLIKEIASLDS